MVHKPIALMILPIFVAGILTLGILAATANAQESNNTGNAATPPAPGVDCTANPNDPACAPAATTTPPPPTPTSGCGPGTDNSTCSSTTNQQPQAAPTAGCGPGTDNSTCKTTTPSLQPTNITKPTNSTGNASADFVNTILEIHNRERAAVGVPALVWSDTLAAEAKTWAEHLTQLVHSTGEMPNPVHSDAAGRTYGENIWAGGATGIYTTADKLQFMVDEKNKHQAVATGDWKTAGHYLQMTSRLAKGVGCGTASSGPNRADWDFMVCRYSPPGWDNWVINQAKGPTSQGSNSTGNGP
jgi:pathogenesis-related protein 1